MRQGAYCTVFVGNCQTRTDWVVLIMVAQWSGFYIASPPFQREAVLAVGQVMKTKLKYKITVN